MENQLQTKINSLRQMLQEKDEALLLSKRACELHQVKQRLCPDESHTTLHDCYKQLQGALHGVMDDESSGMEKALIILQTKCEVEINGRIRKIEELEDELESKNEEMRHLQDQQRQLKESERRYQEKIRSLEELLDSVQERICKNDNDKIARMDYLLSMREETVQHLQLRLVSQEELLREMEETQRRLSLRNEQLGTKQHELSDELHRWKIKFSNCEQINRETKVENEQMTEKMNILESEIRKYEHQLRERDSKLAELNSQNQKEISELTSELKRVTLEFKDKEADWFKERHKTELQLKMQEKEIKAGKATRESLTLQLEELEARLRKVKATEAALQQKIEELHTELSEKVQCVLSLETKLSKEHHLSSHVANELKSKDTLIKRLQDQVGLLQARIRDLEQDLDAMRSERDKGPEVHLENPELYVLRNQVKELEQRLKENVFNWNGTETALRSRIKDLEMSERKLLGKVDLLSRRSQLSLSLRQRQEEKQNHHLWREEIETVTAEKEKSEKVLKEKLRRLQEQKKAKEEEMKAQSAYFEHYKQKVQQKLMLLRDREQSLQSKVFLLEKEIIEVLTSEAIVKAELERHKLDLKKSNRKQGANDSEAETTCSKESEDVIKEYICSLQKDLNSFLDKEEDNHRKCKELQDRLERAEENEEFLTKKLSDFRSRIHELKLSESCLIEEMQDLTEQNSILKRELMKKEETAVILKKNEDVNEDDVRCNAIDNSMDETEYKNNTSHLADCDTVETDTIKTYQLQRLYDTITEFVEQQESQSQYKELKSNLSHLRSQLQSGNIVFQDDVLQLKWDALLDPSRNRATQTPPLIQCIKEAITLANLMPQHESKHSCICVDSVDGSIFPLLDNNSSALVQTMQAVRGGNLEQVKDILRRPKTQAELSLLLRTPVESDLSPHSEVCLNNVCQEEPGHELKDSTPPAVVLQSQADLLELGIHKNQSSETKILSLVNKIDANFKNVDNNQVITEDITETQNLSRHESPLSQLDTFKQTLLNLEATLNNLQSESDKLKLLGDNQVMEEKYELMANQVRLSIQELDAITWEKEFNLEGLKSNLRQENYVLSKRNEDLLDHISQLEDCYQRQVVTVQEENIQMQERLCRLEKEAEMHVCTNSELQQQVKSLSSLIDDLREDLKQSTEETTDSHEGITENLQCSPQCEEAHSISELQQQVKDYCMLSTDLKEYLKAWSEKLSYLQDELLQCHHNKVHLKCENSLCSQAISHLQDKTVDCANFIAMLEKQVSERCQEISLQTENAEYTQKIMKWEIGSIEHNCTISNLKDKVNEMSGLSLEQQSEMDGKLPEDEHRKSQKNVCKLKRQSQEDSLVGATEEDSTSLADILNQMPSVHDHNHQKNFQGLAATTGSSQAMATQQQKVVEFAKRGIEFENYLKETSNGESLLNKRTKENIQKNTMVTTLDMVTSVAVLEQQDMERAESRVCETVKRDSQEPSKEIKYVDSEGTNVLGLDEDGAKFIWLSPGDLTSKVTMERWMKNKIKSNDSDVGILKFRTDKIYNETLSDILDGSDQTIVRSLTGEEDAGLLASEHNGRLQQYEDIIKCLWVENRELRERILAGKTCKEKMMDEAISLQNVKSDKLANVPEKLLSQFHHLDFVQKSVKEKTVEQIQTENELDCKLMDVTNNKNEQYPEDVLISTSTGQGHIKARAPFNMLLRGKTKDDSLSLDLDGIMHSKQGEDNKKEDCTVENDLQKLLEESKAQVKTYQDELEKSKAEAQKWYKDLGIAEYKREEALKKLDQAINEVKRMRGHSKDADELRKENLKLKQELKNMQTKLEEMQNLHPRALSQDQQILNVSEDQHKAAQKLCSQETSSLTKMSEKCATGCDLSSKCLCVDMTVNENEGYSMREKDLKNEYESINSQVNELQRRNTESELAIAALKAKLAYMVQKCQDRNCLILRLVRLLCKCGYINVDLVQEAEDLLNDTALLDYSRDFIPAPCNQNNYKDLQVNDTEKGFLQRSLISEKRSFPYTDWSPNSRTLIAKANFTPTPSMPKTVLPELPLSAGETVNVIGIPDNHGLFHAEVQGQLGLVPDSFLVEQRELEFLQSKCPSPRLSSPEKIINLHQQLLHSHHSNHQINNGNFLQPDSETEDYSQLRRQKKQQELVTSSLASMKKQNLDRNIQISSCVEIESWVSQAKNAGVNLDTTVFLENKEDCAGSVNAARSSLSEMSVLKCQDHKAQDRVNSAAFQMGTTLRIKQEPPAPVSSVHVIRSIGKDSMLIGWETPTLDVLGCSNGTFVYGYRIYVNGEFYKSVMSSACNKVVLENLDLSQSCDISIQTVGANGLVAQKIHGHFDSISQLTKGNSSQTISQTSRHQRHDRCQQFVAIYKYSPLQDSPNIHPSRELAFNEGDIVWVFGQPRKDGFCEAEVNGRRGLAPIAFLEEV
ncbi:GRIP and coiled-coil domain-containing protein 2-like isoform X2 [Erpetoichthys calabaricus]|uniref:GRIP and coiled-coil domain-containing protein 2-like isoform X2 n=1 Tax=Erpetoichthys calabaricus TaxID=27687 RepID=UPI002233ED9A|nr:GRIP and coiled-coil domain-containing protein 2-like isoform X2 [Erpetoichthys calabaricus]